VTDWGVTELRFRAGGKAEVPVEGGFEVVGAGFGKARDRVGEGFLAGLSLLANGETDGILRAGDSLLTGLEPRLLWPFITSVFASTRWLNLDRGMSKIPCCGLWVLAGGCPPFSPLESLLGLGGPRRWFVSGSEGSFPRVKGLGSYVWERTGLEGEGTVDRSENPDPEVEAMEALLLNRLWLIWAGGWGWVLELDRG